MKLDGVRAEPKRLQERPSCVSHSSPLPEAAITMALSSLDVMFGTAGSVETFIHSEPFVETRAAPVLPGSGPAAMANRRPYSSARYETDNPPNWD